MVGHRQSLGPIWALPLVFALTACRKDEAPLPLMNVSGATLESPALNFRVKAPDGWSWSEYPSMADSRNAQYAFRVQRDPAAFFTVVVAQRNRYSLSERDALNDALSILRKAADPGAHSNGIVVEPRTPRSGAGFTFSYTEGARTINQGFLLADGVLLAADRVYCLLYVSSDRELLGEFNSLSRSFELIRPVTPGTSSTSLTTTPSTWGKATGTLLITAVVLAGIGRVALAAVRSNL